MLDYRRVYPQSHERNIQESPSQTLPSPSTPQAFPPDRPTKTSAHQAMKVAHKARDIFASQKLLIGFLALKSLFGV